MATRDAQAPPIRIVVPRFAWFAIIVATWIYAQTSVVAAEPGTDAILGVWTTEDGDSGVEISRDGAVYTGRVTWLREPERNGVPVQDGKNANPALRTRPIMGLEVLAGFVRGADGRWDGGQIYSPRQGRSYPAVMTLAAGDRLEIVVRAGLMSKRVVWTR